MRSSAAGPSPPARSPTCPSPTRRPGRRSRRRHREADAAHGVGPVAAALAGRWSRLAISRTVCSSSSDPLRHLRIERVAQPVAQHVDRQHRQRQEDAGIEDVVREQLNTLRPSAMMLPQVGISGGRPTPRNDRMASTRIAEAQMKVPCTISGAMRVGQHVPPQQLRRRRADRDRRLDVGLLADRRARSSAPAGPRAGSPGRRWRRSPSAGSRADSDTSAMASRMAGIAISPSMIRMTKPSSQRK